MPDIAFYFEKIPANAPPELRRALVQDARRKVLDDVFGVGHRKDKNGNPIEMGRGSPDNEIPESLAAFEKWCRDEPGFTETLAKERVNLARCQALRAAERGGDDQDF